MEQTIGQPVGQTGILRTLNIKKMIKRLLLTSTLLASSALAIQAQDLFLSEGQYYTDESQTTPYTGRYTEFYDEDGAFPQRRPSRRNLCDLLS